jgi:hypothetical protein
MDEIGSGDDAILRERRVFAQRYFKEDLKDQREWYSSKASLFKERAQAISISVVVLGALMVFIQTLKGEWVHYLSAALGALLVMIEGWRKIARYDEGWRSYRRASEQMKHHQRLYVNAIAPYELGDERLARREFVAAIEAAVAAEGEIFWSSRSSSQTANGAAGPEQAPTVSDPITAP